ncbi:lasso peptide biosynthesis PqqD family chaperone [Microbispora sp. ZYX-F-249]|uniref:Lasso peptide biosynthesis PqqD family chaperone n=1 Tax=Microbispora maris TaxID=3144104 RepID=A0ABV0AIQ4_9ACTN
MTWHLPSHITFTQTSTGAVLLDTRRGRYWQMNDTAALVIRHLTEEEGVESALADLRERYPEAAGDLAADVHRMLEKLEAAELVVR